MGSPRGKTRRARGALRPVARSLRPSCERPSAACEAKCASRPPSARDTARAMSQENVKAARRANAAFNRGDFEGVGEVFASDAVLEDLQNAPDQPVTVEGGQAIRETLNLWADAFDELRVDIEEYIDGPNAVICAAHWQGQGKTSGISIDVHQFDLYEFRDGRVIRAVLGFRSRNEALEAAGLSE